MFGLDEVILEKRRIHACLSLKPSNTLLVCFLLGPHDRSRSREKSRGYIEDRKKDEREGILVKTNQYQIKFSTPSPQKWYMYHVQILPARRVVLRNEKGEEMRDDQGHKVMEVKLQSNTGFFSEGLPIPDAPQERNDKSTNLSRRILNKLQSQIKERDRKHFLHDGTKLAFSPSPLFKSDDKKPLPSQVGHYGPADDGTANRPQGRQEAAYEFYDVRVKRECEEDDIEGQMTKNRWFKVS